MADRSLPAQSSVEIPAPEREIDNSIDPDVLRELYRQLDKDSYLEACCHILRASGSYSTGVQPPWTLCGLVLKRPAHAMNHAAACPTCGRPRCPECHVRYGRGER